MAQMKENALDIRANEINKFWLQLDANDRSSIDQTRAAYGIDFSYANEKVWVTDQFIYLPVTVERRDGDSVDRQKVVFALGENLLVTLQPCVPFDLFDKGIALMRRNPSIAVSPQSIMYALLYSLCESCERVVDFISDVLDNMSEETDVACAGQDKTGKIITEGTAQEVVSCLGRCEGVLSRTQESLLKINRAARHLRSDIEGDASLRERVDLLASDLNVVRDHASFEQDKVRFLQSSIMTALSQKQNGIVKVFTIITAVFLPPTLIATFYGMNFTYMPELLLPDGFLITTGLTLLAALVPLVYIRKMGWLR